MSVRLAPAEKARVRRAIQNYCVRAEAARLNWHYSQRRPFNGLGVVPEAQHVGDCSSYVATATYWAMHVTGIHLDDPTGMRWSGWGNTGSIMDTLGEFPAPDGKYLVGDIALWGPGPNRTEHTAICRQRGDRTTAIFSSHGHESWRFATDAPEPITLAGFTSQHLIGVYRMPQLR